MTLCNCYVKPYVVHISIRGTRPFKALINIKGLKSYMLCSDTGF